MPHFPGPCRFLPSSKPRLSFFLGNGCLYLLVTVSLYASFLGQEVRAKEPGADSLTKAQTCEKQLEVPWTWADKAGERKSEADLKEILSEHKKWLETSHRQGKQADLSGAKLNHAALREVNLSEANFGNSDLSYVDFTRALLNATSFRGANMKCTRLDEAQLNRADFTETDLSGTILFRTGLDAATLTRASLKGSDLHGVNFNHAVLIEADLASTDLTNAEFTGADLHNASLQNARLIGTNLNGAQLEGADLFGVIYEVRSDPAPKSIAFAKNIEHMTHTGDSASLAGLRSLFKETGFRDQERKITYALKSRQAQTLWDTCESSIGFCFEYWVNRVLFDLTSQYGMNPGRVLIIILIIFSTSTVLYWGLIHHSKDSGLSIIVPADRDRQNQPLWLLANLNKNGDPFQEGGFTTKKGYKVQPKDLQQFPKRDYWREWMRRERALLRVCFVFSLMSTFNIKFRDVDFGRWLRQLTTKEYDIKATGWARTVSGTQALLSVYFIALLLITYFGRPFE